MVNTIRTEAELLEQFADNNSQQISAQDARDLIVSAKVDGRPLEDATNVEITDPQTDQVLKFNGEQWVNSNESGGTIPDLSQLGGVCLSAPSDGQTLINAGGCWVNVSPVLDNLSDVDTSTTTPSTGEVLTYNGSQWTNQLPFSCNPTPLSGLSDVAISEPQDFQALVYDSGNTRWINNAIPAPAISQLGGVCVCEPYAGQVMTYDGSQWINQAQSLGGATCISQACDFSFGSTDPNALMTYNGTYFTTSKLSDQLNDMGVSVDGSSNVCMMNALTINSDFRSLGGAVYACAGMQTTNGVSIDTDITTANGSIYACTGNVYACYGSVNASDINSANSVNGCTGIFGVLCLTGLPTTDPYIAGQVYVADGFLKLSAGS